VGYRGGITSLEAPHFVPAAVLTLSISLTAQTALLTFWLIFRDPAVNLFLAFANQSGPGANAWPLGQPGAEGPTSI
jgi:hypothetical protein